MTIPGFLAFMIMNYIPMYGVVIAFYVEWTENMFYY